MKANITRNYLDYIEQFLCVVYFAHLFQLQEVYVILGHEGLKLRPDDSLALFDKESYSVGWPWECTLYSDGALEPYKLLLFPSACCALINKAL